MKCILTCIHHGDGLTLDLLGLGCSVERLHGTLHVLIIPHSVLTQLHVQIVSLSSGRGWLTEHKLHKNVYKLHSKQGTALWGTEAWAWNLHHLDLHMSYFILNLEKVIAYLTDSASSESTDTETAGMCSSQRVSDSMRYRSTTSSNISSFINSFTSSLLTWTSDRTEIYINNINKSIQVIKMLHFGVTLHPWIFQITYTCNQVAIKVLSDYTINVLHTPVTSLVNERRVKWLSTWETDGDVPFGGWVLNLFIHRLHRGLAPSRHCAASKHWPDIRQAALLCHNHQSYYLKMFTRQLKCEIKVLKAVHSPMTIKLCTLSSK